MHRYVRLAVAALSFGGVAALMAVLPQRDALAQARESATPVQAARTPAPPVDQIALTEKQVKGMLAASKEIDEITDNSPEDIDKLKPETIARLDIVARRCGLASYAEYLNVGQNISLALDGYDSVTKKYIGRDALIKTQIARIRAARKMSVPEKKDKISALTDALQFSTLPVKYKANIDLAIKYYDQIVATMRPGD